MSMEFTVKVTGTVTVELDEYSIDASPEDYLSGGIGALYIEDAEFTDVRINIKASVSADDVEVDVADIEAFDADSYIGEHADGATVEYADFEVVSGPTGFEVVEDAVGRDAAIQVYVALNNAGLSVS